jgi:hypothetical protein
MRSIDDDAPSLLSNDPEFVHEEEKDDISKLQSLLKELDMSGGVARIFRQRPGQADYPYLSEMPIDAFSLENLKRIFGGGKYLVRFAAKGGRYVRSIRFAIDNCFKGEMDIVPPTAPAAQQNDNTNTMMAFMMQQQQAQAQQQQNMMTLMMTMMAESQKSMAGVMVAAMGGKPSQEPSSKFIEVMMPMLTESMKPRGGLAELAETVKLTQELMGPPQPAEKEEKDDMLERLMTVGAPLIGAFMNRNQPQQAPQPRPVMPSQPAALPPTQEQIAQGKAQDLLNKLRFVTPILARAAKKNAFIDSYLDILDDSLDDEGYEMLTYALQRDDWVTTLFNDNPDVIANRQWFESLREAILHPDEDTDAAGEAPEPGTQNQEQVGMVP